MYILMISEMLFEKQEKIVRKANLSGNGAHVFVPKDWAGEEILLVRIAKYDIKKEILKLIEPYMENILSVFIFGSYARDEQNEKSDVDVLIIANKSIKIVKKGFDIIVIPEEKIESAKKINPILFYSAIKEGKAIINSSYLCKLRAQGINKGLFRDFYKETLLSLKSDREIIEIDKELGKKETANSIIYSLFLRLRGLFIIDCIFNGEIYSNSNFSNWLSKNVGGLDYASLYSIYVSVRDDKQTNIKLDMNIGQSLLYLLTKEIKKYAKT